MTKKDLGKFNIQGTVNVSSKGHIIIPESIRNMMNLKPGDDLVAITRDDKGIIFVKTDELEAFIEYAKKNKDDIVIK